MKKSILILTLLSVTLVTAAAQGTSDQMSRKQKLEKEIRLIEQQIKENKSQSSDAMNTLALVRKKIEARKELVAESERELEALNDSMTFCRDRIDSIQSRLDTMTIYFNRLVRNAYRNRDARVWYMYILASENIGQASRRYGYLHNLSNTMNAKARSIMNAREELEAQMQTLTELRETEQAVKEARMEELASLQEEENQSRKLIARLQNEKSRYTQQLKTKRQQVEALNKEIEKAISSAMSSGKAEKNKKPKAPVDYKLAAEFENNKGKLPWPADGPVMDRFGQHYHPVYTSLVMPFNNGINIGLRQNDKVCSVFDGEVRKIIIMPGYNKCVLVQHGNYFTFYCKLSTVSVKAGQKVRTGQEIGFVDTIDGQTQLHFQLWQGSKPQNPETWLRPR